MSKYITLIILVVLLILPAASQVKDKIQEMQTECRLVRGHAHMIQQMIEEDNYNESVAHAHYQYIETNLKYMEFSLREIETLLTAQQKVRVATETERLHQICNDTKPMADSLKEEIYTEEFNLQRIRILASRINRNLRNAMDILNQMNQKL